MLILLQVISVVGSTSALFVRISSLSRRIKSWLRDGIDDKIFDYWIGTIMSLIIQLKLVIHMLKYHLEGKWYMDPVLKKQT